MPAPPNRRPDPVAHLAHLYTSLIPDAVLKAIGADELNDRLVEAARLSSQASDPAISADLRKAAKLRSQAVLTAQPRDITRRQHRELIAKAAAMPNQWQAAAIRRHADRLIEEEHPITPGRAAAVRKAKADADDTPVPVFDADGNLIGIVDPDKITPVAGTGKKADPAQAAAPAEPAGQPAAPVPADGQVAKSAQTVVYDQWRRPYLTSWRHVTRVVAKAADGPQAALPGDVPGRTVVKSAGWIDVHNRRGQLCAVMKQSDLVKGSPAQIEGFVAEQRRKGQVSEFCYVYDAAGVRKGVTRRPNILPVRRGR